MVRRQLSGQRHRGGSSTASSGSDASYKTYSTAPSACNERSLVKYPGEHPRIPCDRLDHVEEPCGYHELGRPRSSSGSVNTCALTIASHEDLPHQPSFRFPRISRSVYPSDAAPSTPAVFADLFPSNRRLLIHHDDATSDGNMNLRVDAEVSDSDGRPRKLTLFHLRMHDLKNRRFSLRRHCRDSGREICSSSRKYEPTPPLISARSDFQHSLGRTFQPLRLPHDGSVSNRSSRTWQDSDRGSIENEFHLRPSTGFRSSKAPPTPANTVQLEFSNYAHVNVNKRGSKRSKRYEYEFWGTKYEWKRHVYRDGKSPGVSYHLVNDKTPKSIAHITPEPLTAREAQKEEAFGGWVRPCSMQITDRNIFRTITDVAE